MFIYLQDSDSNSGANSGREDDDYNPVDDGGDGHGTSCECYDIVNNSLFVCACCGCFLT